MTSRVKYSWEFPTYKYLISKKEDSSNLLKCTTNPSHFLPAATKLGQGNIFHKRVSVHRGGGVCHSACWDATPLGADPPGSRPPWEQTPRSRHCPPWEQTPPPPRSRHRPPWEQTHPPRMETPAYGQRAAGMHPTGMHSSVNFNFFQFIKLS